MSITLGTILALIASILFGYKFFKQRDLTDLGLCLFALSFVLSAIVLR